MMMMMTAAESVFTRCLEMVEWRYGLRCSVLLQGYFGDCGLDTSMRTSSAQSSIKG